MTEHQNRVCGDTVFEEKAIKNGLKNDVACLWLDTFCFLHILFNKRGAPFC